MKELTDLEKSELEVKLKTTKDLSEWKRIFVIISYDEGQSMEELAEVLRISILTVESYLKEYQSKNKTKNDPRGGGKTRLNHEESQKLENHLIEKTYLKVRQIMAYVAKTFNKYYSRSGMTAWLEDHGFSFKRPKKIPGKLNSEEQAKFIEAYRKLKTQLREDEEIYFMDAVHPEYQSQAVCGWIKKGECKTLQTTGKQSRLHFAGAVSLDKMKLVVEEYESVDGDAIINFLSKLEKQSMASTIHVILDNARAQKNKKLDEFLLTSRLKLHYLPPYSPNLNPIERLWKILREETTYNRFYPSCKEFFDEVRGFFTEKIYKIYDKLKSRITSDSRWRLNSATANL